MNNSKLIGSRPDSYHKTIKCVVVGDGSVGKTCMLVSYTSDKFPTEYVPTIFENYTANVKVDHQNVNLSLWDTAGQEDYSELRSLSYPQADVFIIVFAVTEKSTLENALEKWLPELDIKNQGAPKIIVGNKIDLRNEKNPKSISKSEAETMISKKKCKYIECSALTQEGLKNVFEEAIRSCFKKDEPVDNRGGCCTLI